MAVHLYQHEQSLECKTRHHQAGKCAQSAFTYIRAVNTHGKCYSGKDNP